MSDIDERVRRVLREALALNASDQELAGVQRADDLLGLDSIATIEFALALEREFGITFDPESLAIRRATWGRTTRAAASCSRAEGPCVSTSRA